MGIFSDDRANELRSIFFDSSQEILQALNEDALLLEKSPRDPEIVRNLRRSVHTLKGDSAACGYKELSELAHNVEDVLTADAAARDGESLVELVLLAADIFTQMLNGYRNNTELPPSESVLQRIESIRNPQADSAFAPKFNWTELEQVKIQKSATRGQQVYNVALIIDPTCPMRAAAVQLIRNVLEEVGTILVMRPEANATEIPDVVEVALASHHNLDWVERKGRIPTVVSKVHAIPVLSVPVTEPLAPPPPQTATINAALKNLMSSAAAAAAPALEATAPVAPAPAPVAKAEEKPQAPFSQRERDRVRAAQMGASSENFLRVETERVDLVLDLVGELIIAKSMMNDILLEMNRQLNNSTIRTRTSDILVLQSQILTKLQRSVMKIRMVPVEQMFRRLPRVVRDAAKHSGREVNIVIEGENTDLDKSILDALAEPMMHLLRNAVDHGIEPPLDRAAAGKPPEGTVRLNAYHQGSQVVIEVSDDGAGINIEKVVHKAVERGFVGAEAAAHMSDNEQLDLIFQAGLSTADEVTELSGRGVGMDVVRSVMERLKGTVSVRTVPGEGTTFRLKVPLTLAIIKALLFRVFGRLYAVPLSSVLEIIRSRQSDVHTVDGREVLRIREEVIPLIRLSQMHGSQGKTIKLYVVVVAFGERKIGLVVDHLIGEQELVIKALDDVMINSQLVSGASILGDGRVVLVLSISDVIEKLGSGLARGGGMRTAEIGVR